MIQVANQIEILDNPEDKDLFRMYLDGLSQPLLTKEEEIELALKIREGVS